MSTYYYMGCDKHKMRTKEVIAVIRATSKHLHQTSQLLNFVLDHQGCDLRFFSEHDDQRYSYDRQVFVEATGQGEKE